MNQDPLRPGAGRARASHAQDTRKSRSSSVTGMLLCAALFLTVILISLLVIAHRKNAGLPEPGALTEPSVSDVASLSPGEEPSSGQQASSDAPPNTSVPGGETAPVPAGPTYDCVTLDNEQIHAGDLILVNADYEYVFPDSQPQTLLYGNKTPVYLLSGSALSLNSSLFPIFDGMISDFAKETGCTELLVTSCYRSYEFQADLYQSRVQSMGAEQAARYVALPGHSEHHSGLAVDMVIYTGGRQYYFSDYEAGAWIIENAPSYGFFQRYTAEKEPITRCAEEPWHYRYVGVPHAQIITDSGMCYEEYMDYLHTFTWDGERLLCAPNGTLSATNGDSLPDAGYMIYSVPAGEGGTTDVPVPPGLPYMISGDNIGGFIVTVTLG